MLKVVIRVASFKISNSDSVGTKDQSKDLCQRISVKECSQQYIEQLECQLEEAKTKSEVAEKNFEELYEKYKTETISLKADLQAKVFESDSKANQLQVMIILLILKKSVIFRGV